PQAVQADSWSLLTSQGSEAFQQSNYGQAERLFKQALKEAEGFGQNDLRLATSLTNLGVLYQAHGQAVKAGPLFERTVAIQTKTLGSNNLEVVASSARLCQFYAQRGEWAKSERLCTKVIAFAEHATRERRDVMNSFKKLSDFYQAHRDLENAEILVKQA